MSDQLKPEVSETEYQELYNLYWPVAHLVTLDGKPARIDGFRLRFPTVSTRDFDRQAEYSRFTIKRILSGNCAFKS